MTSPGKGDYPFVNNKRLGHGIEPEDERVLVIYGAGHKRILDHLVEDHPRLEVVPAVEVLRGSWP